MGTRGRGPRRWARAGEHAAIFYRSALFAVQAYGDFWLSQTPDIPSIRWDGRCCRRIAIWSRFADRSTGHRYFVFSAHFDHEGVQARLESARLMLRKIAEIAGTQPVLCIGDFNSTPETPQIRLLSASLRDARDATQAPPYGPAGTFNGFKLDAPMAERIDYVFVGPGFRVLKYGVLSDSFGARYPSDHHPVVARLIMEDR